MGGGAMRTSAKAAAFAGYRSTALPPPPPPRSAVHIVNEGESMWLISSISSEKMVAVQRSVWKLDDWEFAEAGSELVVDLDPKLRLVFGHTPSVEEKKKQGEEGEKKS